MNRSRTQQCQLARAVHPVNRDVAGDVVYDVSKLARGMEAKFDRLLVSGNRTIQRLQSAAERVDGESGDGIGILVDLVQALCRRADGKEYRTAAGCNWGT